MIKLNQQHCMRRMLWLTLLLLLYPATGGAAISGGITGVLRDRTTRRPLADRSITLIGDALPAEQTARTNARGRYRFSRLPPGAYELLVRIDAVDVARVAAVVAVDQELHIDIPVPAEVPAAGFDEENASSEQRPAAAVSPGNTQLDTHITGSLVRNSPLGRNYAAVLSIAPGVAPDPVGVAIAGATGAENLVLIDGLNTTSPRFGTIGSTLSNEFIAETQVITGGIDAQYGRTTGGVVNVVTKSGTNQFHGGAWIFYTPVQLDSPRLGALDSTIALTSKTRYGLDVGFDLGGPIKKNRVWFYTGFHPQLLNTASQRIVQNRTADEVGNQTGTGAYPGDINQNYQCPRWIDQALCPPVGGFRTVDLTSRRFLSDQRIYQWIGKLDVALHPAHLLTLEYFGAATTASGAFGVFNGSVSQLLQSRSLTTHDAKLHLRSSFLGRRLQLDVWAGYHGELTPAGRSQQPLDGAANTSVTDLRTVSLSIYEPELTACPVGQVVNGNGQTVSFNPCPVVNYRYGGLGPSGRTDLHRAQAALSLKYRLELGGLHTFRFGFDFEDNVFRDQQSFTGLGLYSLLTGARVRRIQYARRTVDPASGAQTVVLMDGTGGQPNGFSATTTTLNESVSLGDTWNVSFVPGLTIVGAVRWDLQQIRDVNRNTQISIVGNVAPRVGVSYDFTRRGRSRLYAHYGRLYESIPLNFNDRLFSGVGLAVQTSSLNAAGCPAAANGTIDITRCAFPNPTPAQLLGGELGIVSPAVRGQYVNDVVAGIEYDLSSDLVIGGAYVFRNLGRVVEDVLVTDSGTGATASIIGNPGEPTDPAVERRLQERIDDLQRQLAATSDPGQQAMLSARIAEQRQLQALYPGLASVARPRREYHALVITVARRFLRHFTVLASYTFSRTSGTYPGLFQASNGQLDPNSSTQYDGAPLINRDGRLPSDRPHNIHITGAYRAPIRQGAFTVGADFNALSGVPIEALAADPTTGQANESFLIRRGSAGRTPFLTTLSLRVAYMHPISQWARLEISADLFNVFNQRRALRVDQTYTPGAATPVEGATPADLTIPASVNYGQPVAYQSPFSLRLGARIWF